MFLTIVFMIPIYGLLMWSYYCPEESILMGRKWMYKEEPDISNKGIRYTRFVSLTAMVALPIILITSFFVDFISVLALVIFLLVTIIGSFKILSEDVDE